MERVTWCCSERLRQSRNFGNQVDGFLNTRRKLICVRSGRLPPHCVAAELAFQVASPPHFHNKLQPSVANSPPIVFLVSVLSTGDIEI